MPTTKRLTQMRRAALASAAIAALAIAAPVAQAGAATPADVGLPAYDTIPAWVFPLIAGTGTSGPLSVAYGGVALGDVFNGGITSATSIGPVLGSTNFAP